MCLPVYSLHTPGVLVLYTLAWSSVCIIQFHSFSFPYINKKYRNTNMTEMNHFMVHANKRYPLSPMCWRFTLKESSMTLFGCAMSSFICHRLFSLLWQQAYSQSCLFVGVRLKNLLTVIFSSRNFFLDFSWLFHLFQFSAFIFVLFGWAGPRSWTSQGHTMQWMLGRTEYTSNSKLFYGMVV